MKSMQYEYTVVMSTGIHSDWIMIPDEILFLSVCVAPYDEDAILMSGRGKCQATLSTKASIVAGKAVPIDWDSGEVTQTTSAIVNAPSAIRLVRASGTVRLDVCGKGAI